MFEEELKGSGCKRKKVFKWIYTITINAQTGEMLDPLDTSDKGWGDANYKGFIPWDKVKNEGRTMAEEIKSIFKSRNYWMAFAISFLTLLGYSLSSWLNAISVGESMEYRESALSLSVGGIFFGGFMLLFPFCASVAHATSQVDELRSGMARWRVMRGSVARYVGVKAAASMLAAALATTSAFALHAVIWNGIALPCDPAAYAVHTIYFSEDCVYADLYTVCYGLPMYVAVAVAWRFRRRSGR